MSQYDSASDISVLLTTESNHKKAKEIAQTLLRMKLVACVSIRDIESHFLWDKKLNVSNEVQMMVKTKKERVEEVRTLICQLHSYDIPEILFWNVSAGEKYYRWVSEVVD